MLHMKLIFLIINLHFLIITLNVIQTNAYDVFKRAVNRTYQGFEKQNGSIWNGNFTFIQAADPQFGLIEVFLEKKTNGGWSKEIKLSETAIKEWNDLKPRPKFVVICGDLVNALPKTQAKTRSEQLRDFKKVFQKLDTNIPLVLLGGNHDFGDNITAETVNEYKKDFGDDYFSFWVNGCMFIVINSQFYKNSTSAPDLYNEQDLWVDKQIQEAKNKTYKHIFVFQHIPWFLKNASETENMFNIGEAQRTRMIEKFVKANVTFNIFTGHYHQNAGGDFKNVKLVVTSAIGAQSPGSKTKSGYRIVSVNEKAIQHKYVDIGKGTGNSLSNTTLSKLFIIIISFKYCLSLF